MTNGSKRAGAALLSLVGALTGAASCGDDTTTEPTDQHPGDAIAEAQCARYEACCPGGAPVGGDRESCVEELGATYRPLIDDGGGEGWAYDERCVDAYLALYEGIACDGTPAVSQCTIDWCWSGGFHHGAAAAGDPCSDTRDCDINLACVDGACRNPCGLGEGEPCGSSAVDPDFQTCSPTLVCDLQTSTCLPLPEAGQPCLTNLCVDGVTCIEGTCEAPRPEGAECPNDPACASSYCDLYSSPTPAGNGQCRTLPVIGAPCAAGGRCDLEARCVDGTCQPLPGDGEPCPELECAEGFACAGGVCEVSVPPLCAG